MPKQKTTFSCGGSFFAALRRREQTKYAVRPFASVRKVYPRLSLNVFVACHHFIVIPHAWCPVTHLREFLFFLAEVSNLQLEAGVGMHKVVPCLGTEPYLQAISKV